MIYTITLNPALDRTLYVKKIQYNDSNRIEKKQRYAGVLFICIKDDAFVKSLSFPPVCRAGTGRRRREARST